MRRGVKIALLVLGSVVVLLVAAAVLLPILFKTQLLRLAEQELGKRVEADVSIGDLHLSLFKAFPRLYVGVDGISVVTRGEFAGDTLLAFDHFGAAVNVLTLFGASNIEVYSLDLQRLRAYAHRNAQGRANWDVFPSSPGEEEQMAEDDGSGASLGLKLRRLSIEDAVLSYRDDSARLFAEARDLDFMLRGDLSAKRSVLDLLLTVAKTTLEKGGSVLAPGLAVSLRASVEADLENRRYALGDNELKLNELGLQFGGEVAMPGDSLVADLHFGITNTDFRTLLSLIPAMYKRGLEGVQTAGALQLEGTVKGTLHGEEFPSANLALKVTNARFQYPSLPKGVENIGIDLLVDFDGKNIDSTVIDLKRLHAEMAGSAIDAAAEVRTPMRDPSVRAAVTGRVDLAALHEVLPLDSLSLRGLLDVSLRLAARQSRVARREYDACELDGHARLAGVEAEGVLPMVLRVPTLQLSLTPQQVRVEELQVQAGGTDAQISGEVKDFLPYLMANGTVQGDLRLRSHRVDLNELFPPSPVADTVARIDTAASPVVDLSAARRVVFAFDAAIDSLYFQKIRASDARSRFTLQDGKLSLQEIGAKALGGSMNVSGGFDFSDAKAYRGSLRAKLDGVSVQEGVKTFMTLERLLSAVRYMRGDVSLDVDASTWLSPSFSPDLKSLRAAGTLRTSALSIEGVPAFEKLGALLRNDNISRPSLERVEIPFTVRDGEVLFSPFDFTVKGVKARMGGKVGLDQTLDYTISMQLPRSMIGQGAEALGRLESLLPGGASIGSTIPVGVRVSGPAKSPKVELTVAQDWGNQIRDAARQKVAEVKAQVQEKVEEVRAKARESVAAAVARAEAEAAKMRDNAKAAAEKVLAEAQAQADRLVEEASKKGPLAGFAAKKAAEKVMEEARARAEGLIAEADRKAESLVAEAKAKAQQ